MDKVTTKQINEIRNKSNLSIIEAKKNAEIINLRNAIIDLDFSVRPDIRTILFKIVELLNDKINRNNP